MLRNFPKSKFLLLGAAVLLTGFFAAGCTTTFIEKSGRMANENTSKHVKGYQSGSSQAVRLVKPTGVLQ